MVPFIGKETRWSRTALIVDRYTNIIDALVPRFPIFALFDRVIKDFPRLASQYLPESPKKAHGENSKTLLWKFRTSWSN